MPESIQVDAAGYIRTHADGAIILSDDGDPCCCGGTPPPPGGCCDWGRLPADCNAAVLGECVVCGSRYSNLIEISWRHRVTRNGNPIVGHDAPTSALYTPDLGGFHTQLDEILTAAYRVRAVCVDGQRAHEVVGGSAYLSRRIWDTSDPLNPRTRQIDAAITDSETLGSIFGRAAFCPPTTRTAHQYVSPYPLAIDYFGAAAIGSNAWTASRPPIPFAPPPCSGSVAFDWGLYVPGFGPRFGPSAVGFLVFVSTPETLIWGGSQGQAGAGYTHNATRYLYGIAPPPGGALVIAGDEEVAIAVSVSIDRDEPCEADPCAGIEGRPAGCAGCGDGGL